MQPESGNSGRIPTHLASTAGFLPVLIVLAKFVGIQLLLPDFGDEAEIRCKMILAMLVGIWCKLLDFGTG
jgi:hypothetical protein